mgnify:CR=1 FL=1
MSQNNPFPGGEVALFEAPDGQIRLDVRLERDTVWLTQAQMVELFGRDQSVISRHIGNTFKEGELERESNMQKMHIANSDKPVEVYSLDVIISVGYRVKSLRGTQFRIWATQATIRKFRIIRAANALPTSQNGDQRHRTMNLNRTIRNFRIAHAPAPTCKQDLQVRYIDNARAPFSQHGGLGKVHQLFGDKLSAIIEELNETLAA